MNFKSPVSERLRSRFATPRTRVRIPSGLPTIGCSTMVVHRTVNATVAGSNPATRTKYGHGIKVVPWTPNPVMSVRIRLSVPIVKFVAYYGASIVLESSPVSPALCG